MLTSLKVDLNDVSDVRKTTSIENEFQKLDVDVTTLQETCRANSGTIK